MPVSDALQQEKERKSLIDAQRNRKIQQDFRGDLLKQSPQEENATNIPQDSIHKRRLSMLKAGAVKQANKETGGAVGASVGGTIGSIVPIVGTGIGIFLGRFIGKKLGIAGIIIFGMLSLLFILVIIVVVLKGMCETTEGQVANNLLWLQSFGTTDICAALQ